MSRQLAVTVMSVTPQVRMGRSRVLQAITRVPPHDAAGTAGGVVPLCVPAVACVRRRKHGTMLQKLKAAEGNVPHCRRPGSQDGPVSRILLACHTRQGSRPSVGNGRHPEIYCCRQVCARPSEGEGFAGHCSDGTLLSVYGLMLLLASCRRRVRLIRTCPVGIARANSNRKATSDLRCHAS